MARKYVLITGCSAEGIGSALVEAFEKRNMYVFATGRTLSTLEYLKAIPNAMVLQLDPTSLPSVKAAVETVKAETDGKLNYLVNNAEQALIIPFLDSDVDSAKNMFEIHVWGAVRVMQEFSSLVIAAKGTIVLISSVTTAVRTPWMGKFSSRPSLTLEAKKIIQDSTQARNWRSHRSPILYAWN